jgi:hypothetical protein
MAQVARTAGSRRRVARPAKANGIANGIANGHAIAPEEPAATGASAGRLEAVVAAGEYGAQRDLMQLRFERDQLQAERAQLLQGKEELAAVLEERTRRAQQLFGERAQLETRLRERDDQIQRLNRELGAATRPAPTSAPPSSRAARLRLGARLAGLIGRLGRLGRLGAGSGPPATAARGSQPTPSPVPGKGEALHPFIKDGKAQPLITAIVLGLGRDELPVVLEVVERYCRERQLTPVLLTDHDGLELFRGKRMLFEYLPPAVVRDRFAPGMDWDLYLQRRLALIRRKWRPARIIAFGPAAAEIARSWRNSPFEDEGIEELIGVGDGGRALGGDAHELGGTLGYGVAPERDVRNLCQNS